MATTVAIVNRILSLLSLVSLVTLVSSQCYVSPGVEADSNVVACGSSGVSACCQLGDICLEDSACFNYASGVTYLYGCTDSSYGDAVCPWKCGSDFTGAPYVGVTYCTLNGGNIWTCTKPPNDDSTVEKQPGQGCTDSSQIAFAAPDVLDPILSLPATAGGSTGYYSTVNPTSFTVINGYTPAEVPVNAVPSKPSTPEQVVPPTTATTTTPPPTTKTLSPTTTIPPHTTATTLSISTTPSTTSPITTAAAPITTTPYSTESTSSMSTTTPSTTSLSPPSSTTATPAAASSSGAAAGSHSSSGLSTGAKIGIGVGVAGGVLFLAAVALFYFLFKRRRPSHDPVPQQEAPYSPQEPKTPYTDHPPIIPPVAGMVNNRHELQGDSPNPNRYSGKTASQSELDSYSRYNSPAPTYETWGSNTTARPGHNSIHELGTNF